MDADADAAPAPAANKKPRVRLTSKKQDLGKTEKNTPLRQTNYLLTLNTNKQYQLDDPHLQNDVDVFTAVMEDVLANIDQYCRLREGDVWDDNTIKSVDIDFVTERGLKKGQIHCHALIKIRHATQVQLDYPKVKARVSEQLGIKNVYLYNKLLRPNFTDSIGDYLSKYV